ncbi:methyltransferase family protein [Rudaeicoccus suwonensis]|uniref:Methyltransferase family protein n=2 Tax=Rudaeicoccus suwonensis TaxID=657409 RepID=A0A561E760_9MICO|nr:methyltransferase family protein [Rudaeicoccus suwonensis]
MPVSSTRAGDVSQWGAAYGASFAGLCAGTIDDVLGDVDGGRLLDVGCGTGGLVETALARGIDTYGVDADAESLVLASRSGPGRLCQGRLPQLPFADGSFETVTANFVINHVRQPRSAATELARITAPGGRVVATIWPAGRTEWGGLMADVFAAAAVVPLEGGRLPEGEDFELSCGGLAGLLRGAGLRVTAAREIEWVWHTTPRALWSGVAGGVATVGRTYLAQAPAVQRRVKEEFFARVGSGGRDSEVAFISTAVYVATVAACSV